MVTWTLTLNTLDLEFDLGGLYSGSSVNCWFCLWAGSCLVRCKFQWCRELQSLGFNSKPVKTKCIGCGTKALSSISIGCTVMPPDRRLPCLFPLCPVRFKSQHGCTYHVHIMHTNSNVRECADPEGTNQAQGGSEDGDDDHSVGLADRHGPVAQRIEHPHLTGMCSLCVLVAVLFIKPPKSTSLRL